ncbi:MAG: hypothetical protein WC693_05740 [Patescibacteria group bacterium]|jgi:dipeptidyl aminopeptidase/acylaminoacyl peptidase
MLGFSKISVQIKYFYIIFILLIIILIGGGILVLINRQDSRQVLSSQTDNADNIRPSKNAIAYISDRDGNAEIYLQNADDQKIQRVTATEVPEFNPTLSLDGRKLAFFSEDDGFYGIWIYSLENYEKNLLAITKAVPNRLLFSPDGLLLAYLERDNSQNHLYIINTVNGHKERVTSSAYDFSWSDDSSSIVYTENSSSGIAKTEIIIRTIAEDGKLEDPNTMFVGGVGPVFVSGSERLYFIDASGEYISLASISLRGEGYSEEFQIKIQPKDGMLYRLVKSPVGNELLLSIFSEEKLAGTLFISLDDKVALPVNYKVSAITWDNNGKIMFVEKDDNEENQVWLKNDYDAQSVKLTSKHNNWF